MGARKLLRIWTDPILRKVVFLVLLFFGALGLLLAQHYVAHVCTSRCKERLENQDAKRSLGWIIRKRLVQAESALHQLAAEDDARNVQVLHEDILTLIESMEEALTVLSNGGVYEHVIRTNFENMDEFRETIHYTKPESEGITVEAIELVPKLGDLRSRVEQLTATVRKRIASEDDESRRALADAVALHRMAAEATLVRCGETANKIHRDTSRELAAIERRSMEVAGHARLAEYATAGVLGLLCLLIGWVTLRQVVRILNEREGALNDLREHRNGLNELVNERTAALEQMSRRHELILRSAGEGIFGLDARGSVTFVNPAAAKMLGWEIEELLGKPHHDLIHHTRPDGTPHPQEECPIHGAFQNGIIHRVADDVFWRKDGTSIPVSYISTPAWEGDELTSAVVTFQDITERKRAEDALRESEDKYRFLIENIPDVAWTTDRTGNTSFISANVERVYGFTRKEIYKGGARLWWGRIHPDDVDQVKAAFGSLFERGEPFDVEYRTQRKDGTWIWLRDQATTTYERNGVEHAVGVFSDITERKEAEKALREAEERYRTLMDNVPVGLYRNTPGPQGRFIAANPAIARMFGYDSPGAFMQLSVADLYEDPAERKVFSERLLAEGSVAAAELRLKKRDGTPLWGSVSAQVKRAPSGRIEYFDGMIEDITERKLAEEELHAAKERAEEALDELEIERAAAEKSAASLAKALDEVALQRQNAEEASRLMNNILASVGSIVIAVDENDRVTQWNAAAERIFDLRAEQAVGKPFPECDIAWESTEILEMIAACRESDVGVSLDEIRFTRLNGTVGLLSISVNPMQNEHNEYAGLVLLGADVTEQKVMEHELNRAQKLESVGALAAGIAHEINTPIQFVGDNTRFLSDSFEQLQQVLQAYHELKTALEAQGAAPALLEGLAQAEEDADMAYIKEEIPKAIDQTLEGVARVAKIVRAMKDFSHPDQGEKALADMNHALESTLTVARNELKYVADVVTDFDPSLPPVPCYLGDMNQVFLNVLVNAAHAIADVVGNGKSGKAAGKGTITVTTRREGNEAVIRIADTGTGIPENARDRVFDPFFTTKTVGKGTGQGLSLVHNVVVEKHGGALTFETELGKGTTFIIRLPIRNSLARTGANNEKKNPLRGR